MRVIRKHRVVLLNPVCHGIGSLSRCTTVLVEAEVSTSTVLSEVNQGRWGEVR